MNSSVPQAKTAPQAVGTSAAPLAPSSGGKWQGLTAMVLIGTVIGIDMVGFGIAIGALMFAGPLSGGAGLAVSAAMISTIISGIALALFSGIRCNTGHVQDLGAAVLAQALAATAASLALPEDVRIATALAIVALATMASGLLMFAVGRLGWGTIVRYFPQSVLAGFLAGSGWLLLAGGVSVASAIPLADLFSTGGWTQSALLHALAALGFAAVLLVCLRLTQWSGAMVALLAAGMALFHAGLWAFGLTVADAQATGWIAKVETGSAAIPNLPALAGLIDWAVVAAALPAICTVAFLTLLGALMNTSGLEAVTGQDTDTNQELSVTGLSNIAIAAFAGPPAYAGFASTIMAHRSGVVRRGSGLVMAAVGGIGLFAAADLLSVAPTFVMAGLIIYLGLDLLNDWLIRTRHTYSRAEWAVVAGILAIVIMAGFFVGLVAGLVFACMFFVWSYASVPILRRTGSLRDFSSTLVRNGAEAAFLYREGTRVAIVELQGFVFFGTADKLRDHVAARLADRHQPPLDTLILDFAQVVGLDAAAAALLDRIAALAAQNGAALVLSGCRESLRSALARAAPGMALPETVQLVPSLDEALEQAEERVLSLAPPAHLPSTSLIQRLSPAPGDLPQVERLLAILPQERLPRGSLIMRTGEAADSLAFLESGRVVVRAPSPDGNGQRLRAMSPGAILGDIGMALGTQRTADVVAETDVVLRRLTQEHLARIEKEDQPVYSALLRLQCRSLAEKFLFDERLRGQDAGPDLAGTPG